LLLPVTFSAISDITLVNPNLKHGLFASQVGMPQIPFPQGIYSSENNQNILPAVFENDFRHDIALDDQPTVAKVLVIARFGFDEMIFASANGEL
jgi:hypothetical protein